MSLFVINLINPPPPRRVTYFLNGPIEFRALQNDKLMLLLSFFHRAIKFPFRGGLSTSFYAFSITTVYILAVAASSPFTYYRSFDVCPIHKGYSMCKITMPIKLSLYYCTILAVFQPITPLFIISYLQYLTYKELQRSAEHFGPNDHRVQTIRRATHTFIVVVVAFFLFCAPISLYSFSFWFIEVPQKPFPVEYRFMLILEACNSCANPLIYGRVERPLAKVYKSVKQLFRINCKLLSHTNQHDVQSAANIPIQT